MEFNKSNNVEEENIECDNNENGIESDDDVEESIISEEDIDYEIS